MAFRQRTVTGTIVDGSGLPITNAKIEFNITSPIGVAEGYIIIDRSFTTVTNASGAFSISLWADEDALVPVDYRVSFPKVNSGDPDPSHIGAFSLTYSATPIDIGTLIALGIATGLPTVNINTIIDTRLAEVFVFNGDGTKYLSNDGTYKTVATGFTVGTTPVTSGTDSRLLYQAASKVAQSANLTFDGTNFKTSRMLIGGATVYEADANNVAQFLKPSSHGGVVVGTEATSGISFINIRSGASFWHLANRGSGESYNLNLYHNLNSTYTSILLGLDIYGNIKTATPASASAATPVVDSSFIQFSGSFWDSVANTSKANNVRIRAKSGVSHINSGVGGLSVEMDISDNGAYGVGWKEVINYGLNPNVHTESILLLKSPYSLSWGGKIHVYYEGAFQFRDLSSNLSILQARQLGYYHYYGNLFFENTYNVTIATHFGGNVTIKSGLPSSVHVEELGKDPACYLNVLMQSRFATASATVPTISLNGIAGQTANFITAKNSGNYDVFTVSPSGAIENPYFKIWNNGGTGTADEFLSKNGTLYLTANNTVSVYVASYQAVTTFGYHQDSILGSSIKTGYGTDYGWIVTFIRDSNPVAGNYDHLGFGLMGDTGMSCYLAPNKTVALAARPSGNILIGQKTDDGVNKLQVTGTTRLNASSATNKPLSIKMAASQTANPFEVLNSSNTALYYLTPSGGGFFKGDVTYDGKIVMRGLSGDGVNYNGYHNIYIGTDDELHIDARVQVQTLRVGSGGALQAVGVNLDFNGSNMAALNRVGITKPASALHITTDYNVQLSDYAGNGNFDNGLGLILQVIDGSGGTAMEGKRIFDVWGRTARIFEIKTNGEVVATVAGAGKVPMTLQLASGQTADAFQVLPNGSATPLMSIGKLGELKPASMTDANAPNNSIYYSTTAARLVYKNSAGTVNNLY